MLLCLLACLLAGLPGANIIFGCETKETGEIYKQRADGLFGLGNSDASGACGGAAAGLALACCRCCCCASPALLGAGRNPPPASPHHHTSSPQHAQHHKPPTHPPACLLPAVVNQLVKGGVIDDVFSLCFGMVEGDGALLLGDAGGWVFELVVDY